MNQEVSDRFKFGQSEVGYAFPEGWLSGFVSKNCATICCCLSASERTVRKYLKPDLLLIDDMGLKNLPKHSAEYLLEVIMRRYENRSTIMTSNRPIEEWGKLLGDVPSASAILDRFLHHAQVIANLDRFAWVGSFSGVPPEEAVGKAALADAAGTNARLRLLWIGCGQDDFLRPRNEEFITKLKEAGIVHQWHLTQGGHSWPVWRGYLADFLPLLFQPVKR